MSRFLDGPAAGADLGLRRAPAYLRVVVDETGGIDALDQFDDEPAEGESVHVYLAVRPATVAFVCGRGRGAARGRYETADYRHLPHVDGEALRETAAWRAWAEAQGQEEWAVMAGDVLYAQRPTREEAETVLAEQSELARKFGLPVRVERRVAALNAPWAEPVEAEPVEALPPPPESA